MFCYFLPRVLFFMVSVILVNQFTVGNLHSRAQNYLRLYGYLDEVRPQYTRNEWKQAIRSFQEFNNIKVTGKLNQQTIAKLNEPRCGARDFEPVQPRRVRRYVQPDIKGRWNKKYVTWGVSEYSYKIRRYQQWRTLKRALAMWSRHSPLRFIFKQHGRTPPDIEIKFARREHGDGILNAFDGPGKTLAHAYRPQSGDTHFDEDEKWTLRHGNDKEINLFIVAVHEFGHAIGLGHVRQRDAIMYPYFKKLKTKFHPEDIRQIRSLYGDSRTDIFGGDYGSPLIPQQPAITSDRYHPAQRRPATRGHAPRQPPFAPRRPTPRGSAPKRPAAAGPAPTAPVSRRPVPRRPAPRGPAPRRSATRGPAPTEPAPRGPTPRRPASRRPAPRGHVPGIAAPRGPSRSGISNLTPVFPSSPTIMSRRRPTRPQDRYQRPVVSYGRRSNSLPRRRTNQPGKRNKTEILPPRPAANKCGGINDILWENDEYLHILVKNMLYRVDKNGRRVDRAMSIRRYYSDAPTYVGAATHYRGTKSAYFFRGYKVWKVTDQHTDPGYPKIVRFHLKFGTPRAAVHVQSGETSKILLFGRYLFWEWNPSANTVSYARPLLISRYWRGVPNGIEAAIQWKDGYIYFLKGNKYYKVSFRRRSVISGYPKPMPPPWLRGYCQYKPAG